MRSNGGYGFVEPSCTPFQHGAADTRQFEKQRPRSTGSTGTNPMGLSRISASVASWMMGPMGQAMHGFPAIATTPVI